MIAFCQYTNYFHRFQSSSLVGFHVELDDQLRPLRDDGNYKISYLDQGLHWNKYSDERRAAYTCIRVGWKVRFYVGYADMYPHFASDTGHFHELDFTPAYLDKPES